MPPDKEPGSTTCVEYFARGMAPDPDQCIQLMNLNQEMQMCCLNNLFTGYMCPVGTIEMSGQCLTIEYLDKAINFMEARRYI